MLKVRKTTAAGWAAALLIGAALTTGAATASSLTAEIRTTSYGIPHIKANDWAGLGFGYGYAYSGDNFCILAREVVAANGQLARYFGDSGGNVREDFFYTLVNTDAFIQDAFAQIEPDAQEGIRGFAAGYSRYLRDTGVDFLAADCRGAEWVREIDQYDLFKVFYRLILRASGGALAPLIVDAEPPTVPESLGKATPAKLPKLDPALRERITTGLRSGALSDLLADKHDLGSNMYALGSNATADGSGMVLGNPHFPWQGPLRWYQVHLTIPGSVDVMGASLQGIPLVNIGFTNNFAWSHTVSPAERFTLFEVQLVPGNPTTYLYDGVPTEMGVHPVSIEVMTPGGLETRSHTFYSTVHGWVLDFTPVIGVSLWDSGLTIFALGDANADNLRAIDQFLRMNKAANLDQFIDSLNNTVGLPWVHTVAAGREGEAFYGDVSVVPNVSQAQLDACGPLLFGQLIMNESPSPITVMDGTGTACRWGNDADAPADGILGPGRLPQIRTNDYVTNSNDNHWLANPDTPLEGFDPLLQPERTARSLRTRLGVLMAQQRIAGTDGLGPPGFTLATLQEVLFGSRNYAAEMLADDLFAVCDAEGPIVDVDGSPVDISEACTVLGNWDKKQNVQSFGPQVFLEFLNSAFAELDDPILSALYEVPFDVNDPVNTPRDLKDGDAASRAQLMTWFGRGVQRLTANGIAMNAMWGDLQYETKNGVRYPIHGGRDGSGMFSIITASLTPNGYTPIRHGNSYMHTVTFDANGPIADALLSYSQSSDPADSNYADQTALYSAKQWVRLPFKEADILADPNYTSITITEAKDTDGDGVDDTVDNCTEVPNPAQRDSNGDGFGNFCDADFNDDGNTDFLDLGLFRLAFMGSDPDFDLNGDGAVDFVDLGIFRSLVFLPPGPAAPPPSVSYAADVQPFLQAKCAPCHTGMSVGTFNFAGNYESALQPAQILECAGLLSGECALERVLTGEMPFGEGCTGDPAADAGNAACLTATELATLQEWVDAGLPQ